MNQGKSFHEIFETVRELRQEIARQDAEWERLRTELRSAEDVQFVFESMPDFASAPPAPPPFGLRG